MRTAGTPGEAIVHVWDKSTLQCVRKVGMPTGSIVSLAWHSKINQLFLGTSAGQVHCLYDPKQSEHGIIRAVAKIPKKVCPPHPDVRRRKERDK